MCKKFLKNRKNLSQRVSLKRRQPNFSGRLRIVNLFMLVAVMAGLIGYMGLVNKRAVSGYKISSLEERVKRLETLGEKLELNLAEAKQSNKIQAQAKKLDLVVLPEVEYLEKGLKNLARR